MLFNGNDVFFFCLMSFVVGCLAILMLFSQLTTENHYIEEGENFKLGNATYKCEKTNELKY